MSLKDNQQKHYMIIAIDGYSSCGKSTFARKIAGKTGFLYIDSGAMYRAVALLALRNHCIDEDKVDEACLREKMENVNIEFRKKKNAHKNGVPEFETFLNHENVEREIRDNHVTDKVSIISRLQFVRERLVELQRQMASNHDVIMDGRDIGTVVFPEADLKIFMTAGVDVRAERRYQELIDKGYPVSYEEVKSNITRRDHIDENREISPLKKADDALVLDNTHMTPDDQMIWLEEQLKKKIR